MRYKPVKLALLAVFLLTDGVIWRLGSLVDFYRGRDFRFRHSRCNSAQATQLAQDCAFEIQLRGQRPPSNDRR